jgi:hypothetical protein
MHHMKGRPRVATFHEVFPPFSALGVSNFPDLLNVLSGFPVLECRASLQLSHTNLKYSLPMQREFAIPTLLKGWGNPNSRVEVNLQSSDDEPTVCWGDSGAKGLHSHRVLVQSA